MNEQPQPDHPVEPVSLPDERERWRNERQQRREQRREWHRNGWFSMRQNGWVWGVVLILIGGMLLLRSMGWTVFENWWALFILLPALGSLDTAWNLYRANGNRLNAGARGALLTGAFMLLITFVFLFNLNWNIVWPFLLIAAGLGILLNALLPV